MSQKKAINSNSQHILCLAGAGSGKTLCLTERIARLIKEGVKPCEIFAVTFTVKAADEMRERVEKLLSYKLEDAWIGTFHGLILKMIRELGDFQVIDEREQIKVWNKILGEDISWRPKLMEVIGLLKAEGVNDFYETEDELSDKIAKYWPQYKQYLKEKHWIDFDDILILGKELLNQEHIKFKWQTKFKHVLIDEFQDVNSVQWNFVKKLAGNHMNLFVVGDEDQNIYTWRGSQNKFILSLPEVYPDLEVIHLAENYRSGKEIVAFANNLISHNEERFPKEMKAVRGSSKVALAAFEYPVKEAAWVAKKVKEIADYENTAILYRSNYLSRVFEEVFLAHDIPYRLVNSVAFFKRKEIADLVAFMSILYNPSHILALKRVLSLFPDIESETLKKDNPWSGSLPCLFMDLYNKMRLIKEDVGRGLFPINKTSAMLEYILENFYYSFLEKEDNLDVKLENIQELIRISDCSLSDFIGKTGILHNDNDKGVTLSTVHAAKGLEFKNVFITGCAENIFPYFKTLGDRVNIEEERRIFYVACTRAKDNLWISFFEKFNAGQGGSFYRSRFISEGLGM